mmetsp:Transcript_48232/g.127708  ORF Transcript_48232/g.127708 Transcript_48232/m.127708 type:complete len:187 (-) Transcript_48232:40-600(-)
MRWVWCSVAVAEALLRRAGVSGDPKVYPDGGVAVENGDGKPCDKGYRKVSGPLGGSWCEVVAPSNPIGCVAQIDCPQDYICEGEGSSRGGLCVWYGGPDVAKPHIVSSTCMKDRDCEEQFVCRKGPARQYSNCVLRGNETIPCIGAHDCPTGMICQGGGRTAERYDEPFRPEGFICIGTPKRPSYE